MTRTVNQFAWFCAVYGDDGGDVVLRHGRIGAPLVSGWLALERVDIR
jgi:hypothetical protein